jgi:ferredoxin-NADP reductase
MPNARPPLPRLRTLLFAMAAVLPAVGCQSVTKFKDGAYKSMRSLVTSSYHDPEAEAKLARAEELYAARDYKAAQDLFADLADNTYNPTMLAEKARFYEAECLRERKKLPDAASTYNRMLQDFPADDFYSATQPRIFVCGPTSFVETVADELVALGHDESTIRTERFGPTGEKT